MQSILNFRDVGESVDVINQNGIGAHPDDATEEDVKRLLNFDIHTILDLRARGFDLRQGALLETNFPVVIYPPQQKDNVRKTVNVSLLGTKLQKSYFTAAPFYVRVQLIGYYLICQQVQVARIMAKTLIPRGLIGMYTDFLDSSDKEICEVLEVMTDETNLPILIHCKHGKDRTGIIIAIVLSICGVDDETIAQDYALSQKGLASIMPSVVVDIGKIGLPEEFASATPDVGMIYILNFKKNMVQRKII
ncbi:8244_t:CDS:2 [Dentiscutata erythropus]|uniref:8244_t:CDS:1 n=1 Tax=Dentiscutata erythropus TaxID=1348616 RepID=A0A9N9CKV0_9GLOM|nr:8244_t:CDS:2 [Dentiscutata erythropus]